jgi:hypothetical protein
MPRGILAFLIPRGGSKLVGFAAKRPGSQCSIVRTTANFSGFNDDRRFTPSGEGLNVRGEAETRKLMRGGNEKSRGFPGKSVVTGHTNPYFD